MRIARFYVPQALAEHSNIQIEGAPYLHLRDVLRMQPGHPLLLFNGDGFDYNAVIDRMEKRCARIRIEQKLEALAESIIAIHLLVAVCKGDRFDLCLQKCTELGVTSITPVYTAHTQIVYKEKTLENKMRHWQRIIENACEQCGRAVIPVIHPPQAFAQALGSISPTAQKYLFDHSGDFFNTEDSKMRQNEIYCTIGPEGGFSCDELEQAVSCGFLLRSMGRRVLRAETAAISALALLQFQFGDFNKNSLSD